MYIHTFICLQYESTSIFHSDLIKNFQHYPTTAFCYWFYSIENKLFLTKYAKAFHAINSKYRIILCLLISVVEMPS